MDPEGDDSFVGGRRDEHERRGHGETLGDPAGRAHASQVGDDHTARMLREAERGRTRTGRPRAARSSKRSSSRFYDSATAFAFSFVRVFARLSSWRAASLSSWRFCSNRSITSCAPSARAIVTRLLYDEIS